MKRICPVCNNQFETIYPRKEYCSILCYNKRVKIICPICLNGFFTKHRTKKYCSKICVDIAHKHYVPRKETICLVCFEIFIPKTGNHKYCSSKCRKEYQNRGRTSIFLRYPDLYFSNLDRSKYSFCTHCGSLHTLDAYNRSPDKSNGRCSICRFCESIKSSARRHNISYEKTVEIHESCNWSCVVCGKDFKNVFLNPELLYKVHDREYSFSLDRIVPTSRGGRDIPSNLQTLCWSCNIKKKDTLMTVFVKQLKKKQELACK